MTAAEVAPINPVRLCAALAEYAFQNGVGHSPPDTLSCRQAAVLVALLNQPPGVVLTRRASSLRLHAGQIAFPGGRIDATDADPEAAALREAREEIGLCPDDVQLMGRLPAVHTATGYHVTPVVGLLHGRPELRAAPDEVDCLFTLPMELVRDPCAPTRRHEMKNGHWSSFWVWQHEQHSVWGATAAILVELAAVLAIAG